MTMRTAITEGGALEVSSPDGGRVVITENAFDTDVFGRRIGRLERPTSGSGASDDLLGASISTAAENGFAQLVCNRVEINDRAWIWALESAGFRLTDVAVAFEHRLSRLPEPPSRKLRPAKEGDEARLRDIASDLFATSRFYADPFYEKALADELHRRWITNCLRGRADVVLLAEDAGGPVGFMTCKVSDRVGTIDLVGVGRGHQGKGVGRDVVAGGLLWFEAHGAARVEVRTQSRNYAAVRLYESAGFRLSRSDLTFSLRLEQQ